VLIRRSTKRVLVRKTIDIKDLFTGGSARLTSLLDRSRARSSVLAQVQAALPPELALTVETAGIDAGRLTVGVAGAVWASRLRFTTDALRQKVGESMGVEIQSVRIKVVQHRA
jgi:hypothetical protein